MAYFLLSSHGLSKTWKNKVSNGLVWLTLWLTLADVLLFGFAPRQVSHGSKTWEEAILSHDGLSPDLNKYDLLLRAWLTKPWLTKPCSGRE